MNTRTRIVLASLAGAVAIHLAFLACSGPAFAQNTPDAGVVTAAQITALRTAIDSRNPDAILAALRASPVSAEDRYCGTPNMCSVQGERVYRQLTARYDAQVAEETRRRAAEATETRAPAGAAFEQLTPHDHYLAARAAIDMSACAEGEDCRDPTLAMRHLRAIQRGPYTETHRDVLNALVHDVEVAAQEVQQLEQDIAARGPEPHPDERGGSYRAVRTYLRSVINDPRTYRPVQCARPEASSDHWAVTCSFRASNSFGAIVIQTWTFQFQRGRVVNAYANEN